MQLLAEATFCRSAISGLVSDCFGNAVPGTDGLPTPTASDADPGALFVPVKWDRHLQGVSKTFCFLKWKPNKPLEWTGLHQFIAMPP
jgi:hypothetical protein